MFFKKKKETQSSSEIERVQEQDNKKGLFSRLQSGLSKTASKFGSGLSTILMGQKVVDDELLEDIEMQLLTSDVGVEATDEIVEYLRGKVARNELQTADKLNEIIQDKLTEIILPCQKPLQINHENTPYVILIVGVNGVGKTTTIGKLTKKLQSEGKSVILAAGDTFRAAAVEQLREWGDRNNTQVVYQKEGADSASVIYDAISSAKSRGIDVVIADTAGRLHNKDNLMQELKKVVKVIKKVDDSAPHETMLVVDATTGGNALSQAEAFNEIVNLTGITITKLDGTAKGGIVFSIAKKMGLPLRFIGVGEKIDDLQVFNAKNFTKALFSSNSQQ
ncbi:signal recognition particle-docking protein FtsY [Francisella philomiragia]|uniref:signal recognition particle-docking protein FtsY n=1 Tax=Francisella philomiragia TaxID=28110 RepID=UPI0005A566FE|nr:signal recognition particle-docking protein FtsY [Francisella philomiragia]AJI55371.1 signal recognition particle-docking protein FtsY [Francisella philomiragia]MBK2253465.1 signal recognition particle-docking protein FtsY [Francisella philomiragia]MBK2267299.1 signal recognition particle-docking protein FtsY [Francisella philomiragia]MBK2278688.1 signal recognition particle-docking protein FtsY [Francisella philomiragia]MBK2286543.1 signal recognition particle-docking protein FtsY [Francis